MAARTSKKPRCRQREALATAACRWLGWDSFRSRLKARSRKKSESRAFATSPKP